MKFTTALVLTILCSAIFGNAGIASDDYTPPANDAPSSLQSGGTRFKHGTHQGAGPHTKPHGSGRNKTCQSGGYCPNPDLGSADRTLAGGSRLKKLSQGLPGCLNRPEHRDCKN